jgi:Glyoxalase/Bleomycin resistance protein/Dioxygenase superfamily
MFTGHHYQNAYICPDIHAAIAALQSRMATADRRDVRVYDIPQMLDTPDGPKRVETKLAFVWVGDMHYELIEVVVDETGVYGQYVKGDGIMHFHHVCTRIDDWDSFRAAVDKQDLPIMFERNIEGDPLKFLYLDARSVCGHYLEFCWMTDERWSQMRAM